jgi:hypothetical protein
MLTNHSFGYIEVGSGGVIREGTGERGRTEYNTDYYCRYIDSYGVRVGQHPRMMLPDSI